MAPHVLSSEMLAVNFIYKECYISHKINILNVFVHVMCFSTAKNKSGILDPDVTTSKWVGSVSKHNN